MHLRSQAVLCQSSPRGKTIPKPKKYAGEVFPVQGVSDTQEAAGTLMQGVEWDVSGTFLSLSIYSIPLGVYFKNQLFHPLSPCLTAAPTHGATPPDTGFFLRA